MPHEQGQGWIFIIGLYAALFLMFWFLAIKPRRDAERKHRQLLESLKRGDRVVTAGGLHGRIVNLRKDTCTLEVAEGTRVTVDRSAVRRRREEAAEE